MSCSPTSRFGSCTDSGDSTFTINKGDLAPALEIQLLQNTVPVSLETAQSIKFYIQKVPVLDQIVLDPTVEKVGAITDSLLSKVAYAWNPGDTDVVGKFRVKVKVFYADANLVGGRPITFPTTGYVYLNVVEG